MADQRGNTFLKSPLIISLFEKMLTLYFKQRLCTRFAPYVTDAFFPASGNDNYVAYFSPASRWADKKTTFVVPDTTTRSVGLQSKANWRLVLSLFLLVYFFFFAFINALSLFFLFSFSLPYLSYFFSTYWHKIASVND